MIESPYRPINILPQISTMEILQAFAHCYLAKFDSPLTEPRVRQSMADAWGMDNIYWTPKRSSFEGGTGLPSLVSTWASHHYRRAVIAMPGLDTRVSANSAFWFSSVRTWNIEHDGGPWPGAKCLGGYRIRADQVWEDMRLSSEIANVLDDPTYAITFTGHSLGAAVAEVLAMRVKRATPSRSVRLIRFGCPKVGTQSWVHAFDLLQIPSENVYVGTDPTWSIPISYLGTNILGLSLTDHIVPMLHSRATCRRYDLNGALVDGFGFGNILSWARLFSTINQDMGTRNPLWGHLAISIRQALMGAALAESVEAQDRFNGLEFPDENTVGRAYAPGDVDWRNYDWEVLSHSDPYIPIGGSIGGGGGDWDEAIRYMPDTEDGGGGGGDDDAAPGPFLMQRMNVLPPEISLPRRRVTPVRQQ